MSATPEFSLSTLSTTELLAYLDAQNKKLFSTRKEPVPSPVQEQEPKEQSPMQEEQEPKEQSPVQEPEQEEPVESPVEKVYTELPWSTDDLADLSRPERFSTIASVLEYYEPVVTTKRSVVNQVKVFLQLVEYMSIASGKVYITRHLFRLLTANTWFLEMYPKFRDTVKNKLVEFSEVQAGKVLYEEFSWMTVYPFPAKYQQWWCIECNAVRSWSSRCEHPIKTVKTIIAVKEDKEDKEDIVKNDPVDITDEAYEILERTDDPNLIKAAILELHSKYPDGIAILNKYELAMKYREILGEEQFSYSMHDVEWGYLYEICPSINHTPTSVTYVAAV